MLMMMMMTSVAFHDVVALREEILVEVPILLVHGQAAVRPDAQKEVVVVFDQVESAWAMEVQIPSVLGEEVASDP
eukprot:m.37707 g.37707  ORF g.37707 m.37707 type:complete len:75 (+) comp11415_c0_seq1:3-227(+)